MLVLPIPSIDGGAASAGAVPIQTTPTITALLKNMVRIDLTSLALVHEPIISRVNRKGTRLDQPRSIVWPFRPRTRSSRNSPVRCSAPFAHFWSTLISAAWFIKGDGNVDTLDYRDRVRRWCFG